MNYNDDIEKFDPDDPFGDGLSADEGGGFDDFSDLANFTSSKGFGSSDRFGSLSAPAADFSPAAGGGFFSSDASAGFGGAFSSDDSGAFSGDSSTDGGGYLGNSASSDDFGSFGSNDAFGSSTADDDFWGSSSSGGFGNSGDGFWSSSPGSFGGSDSNDDFWGSGSGDSGQPGSFYMSGQKKEEPKVNAFTRQAILLIAESKTFMVNAISKSLEDERYDVVFSRPNVKGLTAMKNRPNLIIFYVDNANQNTFGTLSYLRELCQENENAISIYLVGNEEEIGEAFNYLPRDFTKGTFARPLNVKLLVEKLRMNQALGGTEDVRKSVLVVDDDPIMLRTLKGWLSGRYHVYMANSGANAIALLARNHVDLVILDYEMPVISGDKVLEMMRSEPQTANIPVMFLTAKDDMKSVMKVRSLKPERYLLKTMAPEELNRNIDDFFRKQKRTDL